MVEDVDVIDDKGCAVRLAGWIQLFCSQDADLRALLCCHKSAVHHKPDFNGRFQHGRPKGSFIFD